MQEGFTVSMLITFLFRETFEINYVKNTEIPHWLFVKFDQALQASIKVHITQKYIFSLKKYLHLFATHCDFLLLISPNLDFLQAVKVTKSGHHLLHDRGSKGYGSVPGLTSQTSLHAC